MILVTGATGFVGAAVVARLKSDYPDKPLIVATRRNGVSWPSEVQEKIIGDLTASTDWRLALLGVKSVIHAAARVHMMDEVAEDPLAEFRKVNVEGTLNLARQAVDAGVQRFIFISSIKVNGEGTQPGQPYTADEKPEPVDPYGISKMEAEQGLLALAEKTGMQVTIIRPVLVYGPGVKANFLSMMKWLHKGIPLPLGKIHNKRSLVALDNLVDLVIKCVNHPAAANQIFLVSDGEDLSTTELLQRMGIALGSPARLLSVPSFMLKLGATLLGKRNMAQRLCGSLQVDISKTRQLLDWNPPLSVDQALKKSTEGLLK